MKTQSGDYGTLIHHMKEKDHWECLEQIASHLTDASKNISVIHSEFEKISENRQELPAHLVKAFIFIEIAKIKLSIMPHEWNETMDKIVSDLTKEHVNYDEMEF